MATTNKTFNGHKNWNHWNVSLWINNDQGLYQMAMDCVFYKTKDSHGSREDAAKSMLSQLAEQGITQTPDGAPYSITTIKAAMRDM